MNIGFIMHPLVIKDLYVYKPYLKWLPSFIIKKKMLKKEPTVVATTTYGTHTIHLIGIPLTCDMFKTYDRSLIEKKLLACIKVAKQYNITLLGVGAYAAIYSKQGALLSGHGIGITSGKALTIGSVMQQAKRYMKKSSVIGVVGAQGAIGKKITELSSQYNIISITRHNMQDISQCDVIISATSDAGLVIDESLLKKNAVVIDAARPYDITRQPKRKDIIIIDGGLLRLPHTLDLPYDLQCPTDTLYACFAELLVLADAGWKGDFCVGDIVDDKKIKQIVTLSKKYGYTVV